MTRRSRTRRGDDRRRRGWLLSGRAERSLPGRAPSGFALWCRMHGIRVAALVTAVTALALVAAGGNLVGRIGPYSLAQPTPLGLVAIGLLGLASYAALCTGMTDWLRPTRLRLRVMRAGWWVLVAFVAAVITVVVARVQLGATSGAANSGDVAELAAYVRNVLLAAGLSTLSGTFGRGRLFWALPAAYWLCALVGGVDQFSDRVAWWAAVLDPGTRAAQWIAVAVVVCAAVIVYARRGAVALR